MLKRGLSRRERARTEETEAAHPAVPATGPGEAREVLPEPVSVSEFSVFVCSENLWKSLGTLSVTRAPLTEAALHSTGFHIREGELRRR